MGSRRALAGSLAWLGDIACAGVDPELFLTDESYGGASIRLALAYCERCPVREACRDFMLETRPSGPLGVVAGGWVFRVNGKVKPHPADFRRWRELVAAAAVRSGRPVPATAGAVS